MKEKHFAFKITAGHSNLICTHSEIEEDKMLDLLKEIQDKHKDGLFWIFKQFENGPKEQLCIIDCAANRIYFHYSGEVESIQDAIEKLSH
ncbi:MAG: hypothetical protein H0U75_05010 [Legionella sp.]|nr:hypothetical protein [Legionella sp.]